ncbi:hypothetical protein [Pseudomonas entomophila]|uniref:hypothetical protein n=1 Tax=Pseudomonas entomophila TaxID=312306 RepID=UPI003EB8DC68
MQVDEDKLEKLAKTIYDYHIARGKSHEFALLNAKEIRAFVRWHGLNPEKNAADFWGNYTGTITSSPEPC